MATTMEYPNPGHLMFQYGTSDDAEAYTARKRRTEIRSRKRNSNSEGSPSWGEDGEEVEQKNSSKHAKLFGVAAPSRMVQCRDSEQEPSTSGRAAAGGEEPQPAAPPEGAAARPGGKTHKRGGPKGSTCATSACLAAGCPPFGTMSVCGRRKMMEDTIAVVPRVATLSGSPTSSPCSSPSTTEDSCSPHTEQPLHFFAVYDGHGGDAASMHCQERLSYHVSQELDQVPSPSVTDPEANDNGVLKDALSTAFIKTDEELRGQPGAGLVGTTAVVALVSEKSVVVANCGDSRAVLCREGNSVALSRDHKPECPDEQARVVAAGGEVLFCHGARVMGVLAMSRAIGDHFLRPYIIPEPEVTVTDRKAGDEFVVLASDGLWDVLTNDEVCGLVRKCLARMLGEGRPRAAALRMTSAVLVKAALARGSNDNCSVIIVDLEEAPAALSEPL